jgi:hypothetical protein
MKVLKYLTILIISTQLIISHLAKYDCQYRNHNNRMKNCEIEFDESSFTVSKEGKLIDNPTFKYKKITAVTATLASKHIDFQVNYNGLVTKKSDEIKIKEDLTEASCKTFMDIYKVIKLNSKKSIDDIKYCVIDRKKKTVCFGYTNLRIYDNYEMTELIMDIPNHKINHIDFSLFDMGGVPYFARIVIKTDDDNYTHEVVYFDKLGVIFNCFGLIDLVN